MADRIITFQYAKDNYDAYKKQTIPASNECMTKADVNTYLNADMSVLSSYANNQLVPRTKISPFSPLGIYGTDINDIVLHQSKLLICGAFNKVNNQTIHNLVRLNSDKSIDTSFTVNVDKVIGAAQVNFALVTQNDKILLGLTDSSYNQNLISLNADGTLDTGFNNGYKDYTSCYSAVIANGEIYTGYTLQTMGKRDIDGWNWQPYTTNYNNIFGQPIIIRSVDINASGNTLYVGGQTTIAPYDKSLIFVRITSNSSTAGTLATMPTIPTSLLNTNGHVWAILSTKNTTSYTNLLIGWSDSTGAYITVLTTNETTATGQKVQVSTNPNVRIGKIIKHPSQNSYIATMYYYGSNNYETEAIIHFSSNAESVSTSPTITAMTKQNIIINGKKVGAIGTFVNGYDEWYGLLSNAGDRSTTNLLYFIGS